MYLYLPIKQRLTSPELGEYETFGIAAYNAASPGSPLLCVPDVSTDEACAALIACRCTANRVEPQDLLAAVETLL